MFSTTIYAYNWNAAAPAASRLTRLNLESSAVGGSNANGDLSGSLKFPFSWGIDVMMVFDLTSMISLERIFFRKSGKNNIYRVKLTNRTPFVNMNPLSRNPGSAPVVEDIEYSVDKSKN